MAPCKIYASGSARNFFTRAIQPEHKAAIFLTCENPPDGVPRQGLFVDAFRKNHLA